MARYSWEIQRRWHGLWSFQSVPGDYVGVRGNEASDLDPEAFAATIAAQHQPEGEWRIAVWDTSAVGVKPVAILESAAAGRG